MFKSELRKIYINKRKNLSLVQQQAWNEDILNNFKSLVISNHANVHCYLPIRSNLEVDTIPVINYLRQINPDLQIIISKSDLELGTLKNFIYQQDAPLKNNAWGIPEPVGGIAIENDQIDVVIIPLLIFDKMGNRLGYGKGFYDRFLSSCRADVLKIGLSYFEAVEMISDVNQFDVPLNICVTPFKIYQFD